jgi:hypothetical protein
MKTRLAQILTGLTLSAVILGAGNSAFAAGSSANTIITEVVVSGSGAVAWISVRNAISGSPTCGTGAPFQMLFDPTTNSGKVLLTIATSAFLANKPVTIAGTGTCTIGGGPPGENLNFVGMTP